MTGKSDGPSKRPYATIDMKATEVKAEGQAPKAAAGQPATATNATTASAASAAGSSGSSGSTGSQREAAEKVAAAAASTSKAADPKAADPKAAATAARPGDKAAATSVPPPAARQGSGFGRFVSHTAAGIVGGVLALLGAQNLAPQLLGSGQPTKVAVAPEVANRLAALEKAQSAGSAARLPDDVAKRIQALEAAAQRTTSLPDALGGLAKAHEQLAARAKELEAALAKQGAGGGDSAVRIAKLEERMSALAAAALNDSGQAGRIPQLAQLTGKMADLETALTNRLAALRKDTTQEIESRIGAVAESSEAARSGTQRLDREVTGIKSETTRLGQRVDQVKTSADRLDQAVRGLSDTATALKDALESTRTELLAQIKTTAKPADVTSAVAPVNARVAALESSVQSVVKAEDNRRANAERIVLSIELGNLKRAMDRGTGYTAELAEVRKVAGNRFDLTALDRYKGEGVLTLTDLSRELRPLAHQIITADSEPGDAGVVDRLLSGARSIVRVRKTSPDTDDKSAEAIVARMEAAVKDGRLGDVLALAKMLSPKAAKPAQDWLRKVEARQSVEAALAKIDAQLKTSLSGTAASPQGGKK